MLGFLTALAVGAPNCCIVQESTVHLTTLENGPIIINHMDIICFVQPVPIDGYLNYFQFIVLTNVAAKKHLYATFFFSYRCKHIFKINFLAVDCWVKRLFEF